MSTKRMRTGMSNATMTIVSAIRSSRTGKPRYSAVLAYSDGSSTAVLTAQEIEAEGFKVHATPKLSRPLNVRDANGRSVAVKVSKAAQGS